MRSPYRIELLSRRSGKKDSHRKRKRVCRKRLQMHKHDEYNNKQKEQNNKPKDQKDNQKKVNNQMWQHELQNDL